MKGDYKPLKELTSQVQKYKTKIKVLHKGYPLKSPKKSSRYQRMVLTGDEGYTMKATLFNNDIERFAEALQRKGEYEIDDALITNVTEEYASRPNECSIIINDKAKINPLITDPAILGPQYEALITIPRDPFETNLHDVLGIVLYVAAPREVVRSSGRKDTVREVHVIDHSYDRPFSISLWNEIITVHETVLNSWADSFSVAGFLALTGGNFKGFTMSSTMSTAIIVNPEGSRADGLREWANKNKDTLIHHRCKLAELYSLTKKKVITNIGTINQRKAHNTWQEELFTLKVTVPTVSVEHMHLYLGCSKCSRKCDAEAHSRFTCQYCAANDAIAEPRVVLKVEAVDETGSIQLPIFAKDIEQLLGLSAAQLWTFTQNNQLDPIADKMSLLREKTILLTVGPTLSLTTSRVLSWTIRAVAFETKEPVSDAVTSDNQPETQPSDDAAAVLTPSDAETNDEAGSTIVPTPDNPSVSSLSDD